MFPDYIVLGLLEDASICNTEEGVLHEAREALQSSQSRILLKDYLMLSSSRQSYVVILPPSRISRSLNPQYRLGIASLSTLST